MHGDQESGCGGADEGMQISEVVVFCGVSEQQT